MTRSRASTHAAFLLVAAGTAIGIAGTDLVLPAIPSLPAVLGGTAERAQLVLAAFTAGAAIGLLFFGEIGARIDHRRLMIGSLVTYGLVSFLCTFAPGLDALIALRFVQGASGAAAAVFAPGMIRALYGDDRAVRALGALGSIEALAPAAAPILGAWLLSIWGWRASFDTIAGLALMLAAILLWRRDLLPGVVRPAGTGSYVRLLQNRQFIGHALGYAFTLGALLVFVFGAPTVFTNSLGLGLRAFVLMQVCGITLFAIAANSTGHLVQRFGEMPVIVAGTMFAVVGASAMLIYALAGGARLAIVIPIFTLINLGLGIRGAPGFHAAILAAKGDDARASALVILAILMTAAIGTAAVAPFIGAGLVALATGSTILAIGALMMVGVTR